MGIAFLTGQSGGLPIKEKERITALASGTIKSGNMLKLATQPGDPTITTVATPTVFANTWGKFDTNTWFSLPNGYKISFWHAVQGSALTATVFKIYSNGTKTSTDTLIASTALYLFCVKKVSDYTFILTTSDASGLGLFLYRIDVNSSTKAVTVASLGSCVTNYYTKNAMMLPFSDTKGIIVYGRGSQQRYVSDSSYLCYVVYTYDGSTMTFSTATQLDYQVGQPNTPFGDYYCYTDGVMFSMYGKGYDAVISNDVVNVTQKGTITTNNFNKLIDHFLDGINIGISGSNLYKYVYDIVNKTISITTVFSIAAPKQFNTNGWVSVVYPKTEIKTLYSDNSCVSSLGCNKFLALSNHFVGSGTWPYSPGFFTFYANADFSVVTSTGASTILVSGSISGAYIAWRDGGYIYFFWNDYMRNGENTRLPYFFVTPIADGALPTVKVWDGAFDANTFGIARTAALNGESIKVLIPK